MIMTKEEAIYFANCLKNNYTINFNNMEAFCDTAIQALKQESDTWSLDDAREDFMYDVYDTFDFLSTNDEANMIIDSFDRITRGLNQQSCEDAISRKAVLDIDFTRIMLTTAKPIEMIEQKIKALSPVTPEPKIGHWVDADSDNAICSCCNRLNHLYGTYCKHCGAKMGVER